MSEYKQTSFSGGMNLLLDDTRLPVSFKYKEGQTPYDISYNQYRVGLNCTTRFDVVSPIASSIVDITAPQGLKQAIVAFGNYIILFVAGMAYYHLNGQPGWTVINGFSMSKTSPRYWTVAVPLSTTLYGRLANPGNSSTTSATVGAGAGINQIQLNQIAGTFSNLPGLLVQDGTNQPQFIFVDSSGTVQCRVTQNYSQWAFPLDPVSLNMTGPDQREYVPIGTFMEWYNGILFIVDNKFTYIYRSVSGRPLDFVVNVTEEGQKGGDATTTSYSVGVSGITAMQATPGNTLFIAAGGASAFSVTLNTTQNAPTIFGEYTFIRTILFNANCITERGIVNVLGDTVFIDANGLRSFNAVEQQLNEGRNSVFSSTVQSLFTGIAQSAQTFLIPGSTLGWCSAIGFDNYAIFSVNTTFGYVLIMYDTINQVYSSINTQQLGNHAAKQFASITIATLALYAITDDDRVVQLFASSEHDTATIRLGSVCEQDPKKELQVLNFRAIMTNVQEDFSITASLFVNNRFMSSITNKYSYVDPATTYDGVNIGSDVGTETVSTFFDFTSNQTGGDGWKAFIALTWTGGGSLTSTSILTKDNTPQNPPMTQAVQQLT